MAKVYENTKNYYPIKLVALGENAEILALVQSVVMKEGNGLVGNLTSRSVIHGGPLFVDSKEGIEAFQLLMQAYNRIVSKKVIFSEIRNLHDTNKYVKMFGSNGYIFNEHLNYILSLNTEEKIWSGIHKSMKRNIKKAKNNGVYVIEATEKDAVDLFYNFISDVLSSARIPLPDISFYEAIFDHLVKNNMAKYHLGKCENEYIGGKLTFLYKDTMYAYSVGVPSKYKHTNVNALMTWEIIRFGLKNDYKKYDFGGAGKPNLKYGVRDFKRHFGGDLVNYGRYKNVHSVLKNNLAEFGLKIYKNIPKGVSTK